MPFLFLPLFSKGAACRGDLKQQGTDGQIYQHAALGSQGGIWNTLVRTQATLYCLGLNCPRKGITDEFPHCHDGRPSVTCEVSLSLTDHGLGHSHTYPILRS